MRELILPEDFLKGEIRNGFYVESMMKRNWAACIKVLNYIDDVCKRHNIQYFADWGTLLGAVRHGGFVPWDDDIDITMKRQDYIKFCQVAAKELPQGYEVVNIHNDADWHHMLAHVVNGRTVNYDSDHMAEYYGFPYVPGVDIFPLDYLSLDDEEDEAVCELVAIVGSTASAWEENNEEDTPEEKMRTLAEIENLCNVKFDYNSNIINQLLKLQERLSMMFSEEESNRIALMADHAGPRKGDVYPKEYYEETIDMPFEYITIPVPKNYKEILTVKYGENYMTPVLGGGSHDYPHYKKHMRVAFEYFGLIKK